MLSLSTPIREKRVPLHLIRRAFGPYKVHLNTKVSEDELEEILAYVEGSLYGRILVLSSVASEVLDVYTPHPDGGDRMETTISIRGVVPTKPLFIKTSDGTLTYTRALCRHFTLLRDYFEEYDDETTIVVPFSSQEVTSIVAALENRGRVSTKLADVLPCLRHLNPICNTLPLLFSMDVTDAPTLLSLVSTFTVEERRELALAGATSFIGLSLPDGGQGPAILTSAPSVRENMALSRVLFGEVYPSWLFCYTYLSRYDLRYPTRSSPLLDLLLTADFTVDSYTSPSYMWPTVSSYIIQAIVGESVGLTWNETKRLLAMVGIASSHLGNETLRVCAPYGIGSRQTLVWSFTKENLAYLASQYPGEWKDSFLEDAKKLSHYISDASSIVQNGNFSISGGATNTL